MKPTLVLVPAFAALLSALLVGASPIPTSDVLVARGHGTPPVINEPSSGTSGATVGQTATNQVTAVGSDPATQQPVSGKTSNAEDSNKVHEGTHLHVPGTTEYEEHLIEHKTAQLANLQKHKNPDQKTKEHMAKLEREIAAHKQNLAKLQAAPAALGGADAIGPVGASKPAGSTTAPGSSL